MEGVSPIVKSEISVSSDVLSPAAEPRTKNPPASKNEDAAYVKVSGAPLNEKNSAQVYQKPQQKPAAEKDKSDTAAGGKASRAKPNEEDAPAEDVESGGAEKGEGTEKEKAEKAAEEQEVRELKKRDTEVRAHEQAHLAALGAYKRGGASFTYETGPDGRQYAVGGEVPVDVSPEKTPEETIRKAQVIQRAALAPAEPSGADRAVAARAAQMAASAQQEIAKEAQAETAKDGSRTEAAPKEEQAKEAEAAAAQKEIAPAPENKRADKAGEKEPVADASSDPAAAPAAGSATLKRGYELSPKQRESNVSRYENTQFPPPEKGLIISASV